MSCAVREALAPAVRARFQHPKGDGMGVPERTCRGEYRGGTPSVVIRSSGMYGARTKSRQRFLPCGVSAREPARATGNTVGGGGGRRALWAMKAGGAAMRHRARSATMPN